MSELSYDERLIIQHMTGLNRSRVAYRNHFVADAGHHDMPVFLGLAERGLMVRETSATSSDATFRVTAAGMQALKDYARG